MNSFRMTAKKVGEDMKEWIQYIQLYRKGRDKKLSAEGEGKDVKQEAYGYWNNSSNRPAEFKFSLQYFARCFKPF